MGLALQREIDFERQRAADAHESLQRIAKMMCQQLHFLGDQWESLGDHMRIRQALQA